MVKKLCPDKRVTKTKALIEAAYLASLKEVGYKKTTVKEICDRAYISRKTFYCHYETIDFLFEELMDRCFQHQSLELSIKIHEAQVKYYFTDYPKYEQIVFELFCESNRIIAENRDTLKIFFETEDPFVEKYIRTRCISSQLPFPHNESLPVQMCHEIISAEKYTFLKYAVLHPEMPVEDLARFQMRTVETYVHFMYTNSITFTQTYGLPSIDIQQY